MEKLTPNLNPWGLSKGHLENLVSTKDILSFKEHGRTDLYKQLRDLNTSYLELFRQMSNDAGHDAKTKTAILAKKAKNDLKTVQVVLDTALEAATYNRDQIYKSIKDPVDTSKTQEIRSILRGAQLTKGDLLKLADKNPSVLDAVLTSPLPEFEYNLNTDQLSELNITHMEKQLGEEGLENLHKYSSLTRAAKGVKTDLEKKLGYIIEVDNKNQYEEIAY